MNIIPVFVLERYVDMSKSIYERVAQLELESAAHRLLRHNLQVYLGHAGDALARGDLDETAKMLQAARKMKITYPGGIDHAVKNTLRAWDGLPPEHE